MSARTIVILALALVGVAASPLLFDERVSALAFTIPRDALTSSSRTRNEGSIRTIDVNAQSYWSAPCQVGEYLRIEFDEVREITAVAVDCGPIQENFPLELDVQLVGPKGGRDSDAFEFQGKRFRAWQRYELPEPRDASAIIIKPYPDMTRWARSGRWTVRDVRIETPERESVGVDAWLGLLGEHVFPALATLLLVGFALVGRSSAEDA